MACWTQFSQMVRYRSSFATESTYLRHTKTPARVAKKIRVFQIRLTGQQLKRRLQHSDLNRHFWMGFSRDWIHLLIFLVIRKLCVCLEAGVDNLNIVQDNLNANTSIHFNIMKEESFLYFLEVLKDTSAIGLERRETVSQDTGCFLCLLLEVKTSSYYNTEALPHQHFK
jgi:hypothetical protein